MRLTEFMIVIIAALMFLIPTMRNEQREFEREAQEEAPIEEMIGEESHTYKVLFESRSPEEEKIADILWMKKAAETATDAGIPYFNVLKQKMTKRFVPKLNREVSVVEGVIQLDNDPINAEYDAHEIESLVLTDE